jgi:anti-sigma factor RsiW
MNHPGPAEWMSFLYGEIPAERKQELDAHLAQCPACASHVQSWGATMNTLDQWTLPEHRSPRRWTPALKWAAAAAIVLALGFDLGRRTSTSAAEIADLKRSIARLDDLARPAAAPGLNNNVPAATARAESLRLLAEFSRLQQEQRAADLAALKLSLQDVDVRLAGLRSELETVAVNTQTGFQETHQNLTHLVSLSLPPNNEPSSLIPK